MSDPNGAVAQEWRADPEPWYPTFDVVGLGTNQHLYHESGTSTGAVALSAWNDWGTLGSSGLIGGPAVATWGPGVTHVFALDAQYHLRHGYVDASWAPCATLAGAPCFDDWGYFQPFVGHEVSVSSWGNRHLDVFATVGFGPNQSVGMLYQRTWDNMRDSGWVSQSYPDGGATVASAPASVSAAPGVVDAFVFGTDGGIYRASGGKDQPQLIWTQWAAPFSYAGAPVKWVGKPAVASWGPARFDVFGVDSFGLMFDCYGDHTQSSQTCVVFAGPPGLQITSPAVTQMGPDHVVVSVRGSDGQGWIRGWSPVDDMGVWSPTGGALAAGASMALQSCPPGGCAPTN
jgi:hypothetical protein